MEEYGDLPISIFSSEIIGLVNENSELRKKYPKDGKELYQTTLYDLKKLDIKILRSRGFREKP